MRVNFVGWMWKWKGAGGVGDTRERLEDLEGIARGTLVEDGRGESKRMGEWLSS